jgi:hypothetical protein
VALLISLVLMRYAWPKEKLQREHKPDEDPLMV